MFHRAHFVSLPPLPILVLIILVLHHPTKLPPSANLTWWNLPHQHINLAKDIHPVAHPTIQILISVLCRSKAGQKMFVSVCLTHKKPPFPLQEMGIQLGKQKLMDSWGRDHNEHGIKAQGLQRCFPHRLLQLSQIAFCTILLSWAIVVYEFKKKQNHTKAMKIKQERSSPSNTIQLGVTLQPAYSV